MKGGKKMDRQYSFRLNLEHEDDKRIDDYLKNKRNASALMRDLIYLLIVLEEANSENSIYKALKRVVEEKDSNNNSSKSTIELDDPFGKNFF